METKQPYIPLPIIPYDSVTYGINSIVYITVGAIVVSLHQLPNMFFHAVSVGFLLLLATYIVKEAHALPSGFIAETVTSKNAISGTFAKNPRNDWKPMMLLVNQGGKVSAVEDPDESSDTTEILDMDDKICTNVERGLQSIAIHPNFEDNRYVYLYYTKHKDDCLADNSEDGPWNVISRFVMNPETLMLDYDEREEIWRGAPLHDSVHNGGAMTFGNDDKLYVATGDGGTPENAQDSKSALGSLIRLNDDGSSPDDNPYTTASGYESYHCRNTEGKVPLDASNNAICSEIFATGLRNPFRLSMDPNEKEKTRLAISDVGGRTWEEINYAGTDYEGANITLVLLLIGFLLLCLFALNCCYFRSYLCFVLFVLLLLVELLLYL